MFWRRGGGEREGDEGERGGQGRSGGEGEREEEEEEEAEGYNNKNVLPLLFMASTTAL